MSSYIIAGSADSIDTAYCQQVARLIKQKYHNIDFRIVIKHPSEWQQYLQQICRIYGFLNKSNPIVYTFDGKIIGNREAFVFNTIKYFGLEENKLKKIANISNKINMKLAEKQIKQKEIIKNNIKTINQKIQYKYKYLLEEKIFKYKLNQSINYLKNGIEYIFQSVQGLCQNIKFIQYKEIQIKKQEFIVEELDLNALMIKDKIKIQENKDTFVTTNQQQQLQQAQSNSDNQDRVSEISKTNKMHESIVSHDKDSKGMRQSSKKKLQIDQEENDTIPDYIDQEVKKLLITELADDFYVAFMSCAYVTGEMIFYHNENTNGNYLRLHNDGRHVKGHCSLIKQVYYENNNEINQEIKQDQNEQQQSNIQSKEQIKEINQNNEENKNKEINENENKQKIKISQQVILLEQKMKQQQNINNKNKQIKIELQKSKTQPNIQLNNQNQNNKKINLLQNNQQQGFSEIQSDLNLISHLNYHTLFINKPLSNIELKNILYFIQQTDTIGTLQFLGQNPNPKLKLYYRKYIIDNNNNNQNNNHNNDQNHNNNKLPVQIFIKKQIQENQYQEILLPKQEHCHQQNTTKYSLICINDIGFQHFIHQHTYLEGSEDVLAKVIRATIQHILQAEYDLRKQIGYNLIITKEMTMIVPSVRPYKIYNAKNLYLNPLAYLGYIQIAKVIEPYSINGFEQKVVDKGEQIRKMLHDCARLANHNEDQ